MCGIRKGSSLKQRPKKRHRGLWLLPVFALMGAVIVYDSATRIVTDEFTLGNARLPESFEGFRIVHLSDLHAASFGEGNGELLAAVRAAEPEIVCITGDLVDGSKDRQEKWVRELIPQLTAVAPVYYVTGNHEWVCGWTGELLKLLEDLGVHVLRGEYLTYGRGDDYIVIAGVDDPNGPADQRTPAELVGEIRASHPGKYILMLAHRDTELEMWSDLGVDAVLCGHAHGGLVRLPFTDGLIAPGQGFFPTWTAGIYEQGGTQMLVSRGFTGSHGAPRVFNNPEVVAITMTRG